MKLVDRIKADRELFASLSPESKRYFIWDYYKIPIVSVAIVLIMAVLALITAAQTRDIAMYAVFVNSDVSVSQTDPETLNALLARGGVDMADKEIDITADLTLGMDYNETEDGQTIQVLAALFGISGLDVFAADQSAFDRYAVQDAFVDLNLFLEPELLESDLVRPYYYENIEGRTILGGIVLLPGSLLHETGYYHSEVILGVAQNAQNLDEAIVFVQQLLMESTG